MSRETVLQCGSWRVERVRAPLASVEQNWKALEEAGGGTLFQSWPWVSSWWNVWKTPLRLKPCLLVVKWGDEIQGILPLYHHDYRLAGITVRQLQVMGNAWRLANTVRSEYTQPLVRFEQRDTASFLLARALRSMKWGDMILPDLSPSEGEEGFWRHSGALAIERQVDSSWYVDTRDVNGFSNYLSARGKNTRLKLYNRRTYLEKKADVVHEWVDPNDTVAVLSFFEQLNGFHQQRWGQAAFDMRATAFHLDVISKLNPEQVYLGVLRVDGEVVSVSYNLLYNGVLYNLQSGYLQDYDPKVSLGTLHMGYVIELAFLSSGIRRFDMLAGGGKYSAYKAHLATHEVTFKTLHLIRQPLLRLAMQGFSLSPQPVRYLLARLARLNR